MTQTPHNPGPMPQHAMQRGEARRFAELTKVFGGVLFFIGFMALLLGITGSLIVLVELPLIGIGAGISAILGGVLTMMVGKLIQSLGRVLENLTKLVCDRIEQGP